MTSPLVAFTRRGLAFLAWSSLIGLAACGTPQLLNQVQYRECDEPQQAWPTRPWGLVKLVDGFPIYGLDQFPADPYEIRGIIHFSLAPVAQNDVADMERAVVERARGEGGHAVLKAKASSPAARIQETDYLVITFKTNSLANALDRIKVYMALTAGNTNSDLGSETDSLAAHRAELEKLTETLRIRL